MYTPNKRAAGLLHPTAQRTPEEGSNVQHQHYQHRQKIMSITSSYGYRSAQAAWENTNPYDSDCTCEGEGFICDDCGHISDTAGPCPDTEENHPDDATRLRAIESDEVPEYFPSSRCPSHGWCTGCTRRNCEDCGGDDHDDRD